MTTEARLEERIARLPCWQGRVSLAPLKGGLTNISYVASDGTGKYVVRCGEDIPVHNVFRDRERAASRAAHAAGLSPEVIYEAPSITVLRFIEGRTFEERDFAANIPRLVVLLRTCHRDVARFVRGPTNEFWVFQVIRDYVRLIDADAKYLELADRLQARQVAMPVVFGHHDLLPGNVIDDGRRLWLIDWEYGAYGTAMFDLANLSSNGRFDGDQDQFLLDAYFEERVSPEMRGAFEAMKAASLLREALWALVSDVHLKTPGVDYHAHAREYLKRLDASSPF